MTKIDAQFQPACRDGFVLRLFADDQFIYGELADAQLFNSGLSNT
jgi:hypothetical protein